MENQEKEHLLARISAGCIRLRVEDRRGQPVVLLLKRPSREQSYLAQEIYSDALSEGLQNSLFSEDELDIFLLEKGLWDVKREELYVALPKDIENFKLQLYKQVFKSSERAVIRKALQIAKSKLGELHRQKFAYSHLSVQGCAALSRLKYLVGCSLYQTNGKPVFSDENFWQEPSYLLSVAMAAVNESKIDDSCYRELARTDPWRTTWNCRKAEQSVFGIPSVDYTEEQKTLVGWTCLYDNIYEHPDCPGDDVVSDDDMLDGWLIEQRRLREDRQIKKSGDELVTNDKVRNSQEIFLVANTPEDARKIDRLNENQARHDKKQRFALLQAQGSVNEADMPDTKRRIQMDSVKLYAESLGK